MTGRSLARLQSHAEPLLRQLRGSDRRAVMALIACVSAERRRIGLGSERSGIGPHGPRNVV